MSAVTTTTSPSAAPARAPQAPPRRTVAATAEPVWVRRTLIGRLCQVQAHDMRRRKPDKAAEANIGKLLGEAYREFAKAWEFEPAERWAAVLAMRCSASRVNFARASG